MHPIDSLFAKISIVEPYPSGVIGIPNHISDRILGVSFFPGGDGLWKEPNQHPNIAVRPKLPVGKIMILGHNFDSATNFRKSLQRQAENLKSPTWRHLLTLLHATQI